MTGYYKKAFFAGAFVFPDDVYGVIFFLLLKWYAAHFHCLLLDSLF